jgi:hypothetical protein
LYLIFTDRKTEPTEEGRLQFFEYESYGKYPETPDPYFLSLQQGKKWFSVQQEDIRDKFLTWEWWGFYCYWVDWKGQRWALEHLFSWCSKDLIPNWFYQEDNMDQDCLTEMVEK